MDTRRNSFGRGCFLVGLGVLYLLLGMKLYVSWREGVWQAWPLGDYLPDAVVRAVFSLGTASIRSALVWILSQDVVIVVAAVCLLLWLLGLFGNEGDSGGDSGGDVSR